MSFYDIYSDYSDHENTCICGNVVKHLARGGRNDNNAFHNAELQDFGKPCPVCTWPEVMLTA